MIKCGTGSILARERAALALARLFSNYQVPLTVVTNGEDAVLLNTLSGETIDNGLIAIPNKNMLLSQMEDFKFLPFA